MKLKTLPNKLRRFAAKHDAKIVAACAVIVAAVSTTYYFVTDKILAYGDAESHINIAKRVVSGLSPGVGQLGGVWLPLHHLFMAPFVANDYLWRTGLGGSIVSAIAYVVSVYFLYKLARFMTNKVWAALTATAIYALNPNILYMLATPMSELLLLAFLISSWYFFIRWVTIQDVRLLVIAGLLSFGGTLVRYDAWFLIFIQFLAVIAVSLIQKWPFKKLEGSVILFLAPSILGVALWMLWCLLIFQNPLYFLNGPYSAKSQQLDFIAKGELPTYHHLWTSIVYYSRTVIENAGWLFSILAIFGAGTILAQRTKKKVMYGAIILVVLSATFLFNIVALFLGISILYLPELTPKNFEFHLFNVRYGVMTIPTIALLTGVLISRIHLKSLQRAAAVTLILLAAVFAFTNPITLKDGVDGLSKRIPDWRPNTTMNSSVVKYYDYGYIAFDDYKRSANPVDLGVPMNKLIYVGAHPYWEQMIDNPNDYARFIIIERNDALWKRFHNSSSFKRDYKPLAKSGDTTLYKCTHNCAGDIVLTKTQ